VNYNIKVKLCRKEEYICNQTSEYNKTDSSLQQSGVTEVIVSYRLVEANLVKL
jgi:hypothetical protein